MQRFLEAVSISAQAIWANKLRALLTVLGNVVAVTSIIAVVSLVQGLNATVRDSITSGVGADTFTVNQFRRTFTAQDLASARRNPRVDLADVEAVRQASDRISYVMASSETGAEVKYRQRASDSVEVTGVTSEYARLSTTNVGYGRMLTRNEFDDGRRVAFLGSETAERLFEAIDPIGKTITIAGAPYRVVGVAEPKGSVMGFSQDGFVIIPLGAFHKAFGSRRSLAVTVVPTDAAEIEAAMDDVRAALRVHRRLRPRDPDDFGVYSADTFLQIYEIATTGLFTILIGVVSLSLVVGGIVIMNIMLMVVTERTREIGLRKSLGARRRDILWQILTESTFLSTFGGVVGIVFGFAVAYLISLVSPLPATVELWSVVLGIGVTAAVGLFFGLYPAMRAATLDPIEALGRE